jgi:hypothetical protein
LNLVLAEDGLAARLATPRFGDDLACGLVAGFSCCFGGSASGDGACTTGG